MNTLADSIETDERGLLVACPHCSKRNRMTYERLGQTFRCGQCHTELPSPADPLHVSSESAFEALLARAPFPILVDFWAAWCGPCKMIAPELVKVAAEGAGRWLIAKVSTEDLPGLAQRFQISSIPTLALFKSGHEVTRQAGAIPAAAIRQFIEQAS